MSANPGTDLMMAVGWESLGIGHETLDAGTTVIDAGDPPSDTAGVISGRGALNVNPDKTGESDKSEITGLVVSDNIIVCGYVELAQIGSAQTYNSFAAMMSLGARKRNIAVKIDAGANTHQWAILDENDTVIVESKVFSPTFGVTFSFWFYWWHKRTTPTRDFLYIQSSPGGHVASGDRGGDSGGGFSTAGFISIGTTGATGISAVTEVRAESSSTADKGDGNHIRVDDWCVYGDSGMKYGIYAGVILAKPEGDTGEDQWSTTGAGAGKWDRWEEVPSDDATTFLKKTSGPTVRRQLSDVQNNDSMVDTRDGGGPDGQPDIGRRRVPIAVIQRLRARVDNGTEDMKFRGAISGGGSLTGPLVTPGATFRSFDNYWVQEQTPEATPRDWNPILINSMQWGAESAGSGNGSRDVTCNWPNVVYEVPRRGLPVLM